MCLSPARGPEYFKSHLVAGAASVLVNSFVVLKMLALSSSAVGFSAPLAPVATRTTAPVMETIEDLKTVSRRDSLRGSHMHARCPWPHL